MDTGKKTKYLKYAIGEIVLVVIGILIALQINNWNEKQKSKSLAKTYLKEIKQDLIADTMMFNAAINRATNTIAKNQNTLEIKNIEAIGKDSLYLILAQFHSMRKYLIKNNTYQKLVNTGFLDSEYYKDIFSIITNYYTNEYVTYSEYIEWDEEQTTDFYHNDFFGTYKDKIDMAELANASTNELYSEKLQKTLNAIREFIISKPFRNKVFANYTRKMAVVDRINEQKELATVLLNKINQHL